MHRACQQHGFLGRALRDRPRHVNRRTHETPVCKGAYSRVQSRADCQIRGLCFNNERLGATNGSCWPLKCREDVGASSRLITVAVRTSPTFEVLKRTPLFDMSDFAGAEDHANYDVHRDGDRFVMVRNPQSSQVYLIQNWPALLRDGGSPRGP